MESIKLVSLLNNNETVFPITSAEAVVVDLLNPKRLDIVLDDHNQRILNNTMNYYEQEESLIVGQQITTLNLDNKDYEQEESLNLKSKILLETGYSEYNYNDLTGFKGDFYIDDTIIVKGELKIPVYDDQRFLITLNISSNKYGSIVSTDKFSYLISDGILFIVESKEGYLNLNFSKPININKIILKKWQ